MKKIVLSLLLLSVTVLNAAEVRWDCFIQSGYFYNESGVRMTNIDYNEWKLPNYIFPSVAMSTSKDGDNVTISGVIWGVVCEFQGLWLEKSYGDLIDASTMTGKSEFFSATDYTRPKPEHSNLVPIETTVGSTVYLALLDGVDDPNTQWNYYGWIELYVEESGDVTLMRSAMDIDGDPIICGGGSPIPEPGSAVLMLVGVGLLALRRRERRSP